MQLPYSYSVVQLYSKQDAIHVNSICTQETKSVTVVSLYTFYVVSEKLIVVTSLGQLSHAQICTT